MDRIVRLDSLNAQLVRYRKCLEELNRATHLIDDIKGVLGRSVTVSPEYHETVCQMLHVKLLEAIEELTESSGELLAELEELLSTHED